MNSDSDIKLVVGHMAYQTIETGYWALIDREKKYRLKNIPEELKQENLKIAATLKESEEEMSIYMSGISAILIEYKLI